MLCRTSIRITPRTCGVAPTFSLFSCSSERIVACSINTRRFPRARTRPVRLTAVSHAPAQNNGSVSIAFLRVVSLQGVGGDRFGDRLQERCCPCCRRLQRRHSCARGAAAPIFIVRQALMWNAVLLYFGPVHPLAAVNVRPRTGPLPLACLTAQFAACWWCAVPRPSIF